MIRGSRLVDDTGMASAADRRDTPRVPVVKPAKVFHRGSWKYLPARTRNASVGGVLVEITHAAGFCVGDIVDIAIGRDGSGVLRSEEFVAGRVVRVEQKPDGERAAIVLARPLDLALAA